MKSVRVLAALVLAALMTAAQGQGNYYEQIQPGSRHKIPKAEFQRIENRARSDFASPQSYVALSDLFLNTTERVWSLVYAEAYCNLEPASPAAAAFGKRIVSLLRNSISRTNRDISISLTKTVDSSTAARGEVPFETNYEMALALGIVTSGVDVSSLSLSALSRIREAQMKIWVEKGLPRNEFVNRLLAIRSAGLFEAYNYWLFSASFPRESAAWKARHRDAHEAWQTWVKNNPWALSSNDFHRLAVPVP